VPPHVNREQRAATIARLLALREAGLLTPTHLRTAADALGIAVRTVQRWIARGVEVERDRPGPEVHTLSEPDREAFAFFHGNIAAVFRARAAAVAGDTTAAGVPIPDFLIEGWTGVAVVSERTLRRSFAASLTQPRWLCGAAARRATARRRCT
jgi:putative transposase